MKVAYIRVPKCSSRTILYHLECLREYQQKNRMEVSPVFVQRVGKTTSWNGNKVNIGSITDFNKLYQEQRKNFFVFTFIRNPWDRAISAWTHALKNNFFKGTLKDYFLNVKSLKLESAWFTGPQSNFIFDENNSLNSFDFIGHVETMNEDWKFVHTKILESTGVSLNQVPERINVSFHLRPKKTYKEILDEDKESKAIIEELYKEDIEKLGYTY